MPADMILHNAKIATNHVPSFVEAIAVEGGKIVAAGTTGEVLRQRGLATRVIDANGRTVIPGLYDSHLHLSYVYFFAGPFFKETPPGKDIDYFTVWMDYKFWY